MWYRCVSMSRIQIRPDYDQSEEFVGLGTFLVVLYTLARILISISRTFLVGNPK